MEESTSREKVLKKIRNALLEKTDNPYSRTAFDSPIYTEMEDGIDLVFAENFTKAGGKFIYCENEEEAVQAIADLAQQMKMDTILCRESDLQAMLSKAGLKSSVDFDAFKEKGAGITSCEALIARSGSILVSSRQSGGRKMNAYPDTHIVLAKTSQLLAEIADGLEHIKTKYGVRMPSMISLITGPSRTADIEKTLVMGVHGPRDLFLILIEDLPEVQ